MTARRRRRRLATLGGVAAATAAVVATVAMADDGSADASSTTSTIPSTANTVAVARRDLARTIDVDGTLGYGDTRSVRAAGGGIVTGIPEPGTIVQPDEPLYHVDGEAGPILLDGALPMWRPLHVGVDGGPDVAQLEANLAYLGYGGELTVDEEFTSATAAAVEAWQESHGLDGTGRVELGDVWYAVGAVRIASTVAELGDPANGEILSVTGTERLVHVDVDATDARHAVEGASVEIELADGTTTTGTVTAVADAATVTPGQNGGAPTTTVAVEVTPGGPVDALDESPVTVRFVTDEIAGALAVPLEAVVALPDGGYALEVVEDGGATRLAEVELGRFADGWVAVTGDVAEGDTVVTA